MRIKRHTVQIFHIEWGDGPVYICDFSFDNRANNPIQYTYLTTIQFYAFHRILGCVQIKVQIIHTLQWMSTENIQFYLGFHLMRYLLFAVSNRQIWKRYLWHEFARIWYGLSKCRYLYLILNISFYVTCTRTLVFLQVY